MRAARQLSARRVPIDRIATCSMCSLLEDMKLFSAKLNRIFRETSSSFFKIASRLIGDRAGPASRLPRQLTARQLLLLKSPPPHTLSAYKCRETRWSLSYSRVDRFCWGPVGVDFSKQSWLAVQLMNAPPPSCPVPIDRIATCSIIIKHLFIRCSQHWQPGAS